MKKRIEKIPFQELVNTVREQFRDADVSKINGKLAMQFNLTGEGGGTFYAEVKNGVLSVEPYEYYDRDAALTMSVDVFLKLMNQELDPVEAYTKQKLFVEGDVGKALIINDFIGN